MCSFDCSSYMQVPITTNNDAHSRYVSPFLEKNYAGFGTSFWRETGPEGATQENPGRKPWEQAQQQREPRRGEAVGAGIKEVLMTSIHPGLRPNLPAPPFRASCNLDLEPRACVLRCPAGPFGSLGFVTETGTGPGLPDLGPRDFFICHLSFVIFERNPCRNAT